MKPVTNDWLHSAKTDLQTIDAIIGQSDLTAVVAFHAQQCVEKCLKALHEEFSIRSPKTHNLLTLKAAVELSCPIKLDEDTLSLLNKLYIDARYPGEFGLLPTGRPSPEEAKEFSSFAYATMASVTEILT